MIGIKYKNKLIALLTIATLVTVIDLWRIKDAKNENIQAMSIRLASISESTKRWDSLNILALKNLASQPDIISMDSKLQKPVLERFVDNYQQFYLAFTMDREGVNVARSDNNQPKNYRDRNYYRRILLGEKIVYQSLIGRSNKRPALCIAAPIEKANNLLGLSVICSNLESLSAEIGSLQFGNTGSVFLVDRDGKLLAHPNSSYLRGENLRNLSEFAPVKNLLEGRSKKLAYFDKKGEKWMAVSNRVNSEWGIIITANYSELTPESYW